MNMMLHGIANANIQNKDSLSETNATAKVEYTLILANRPLKAACNSKPPPKT